MDQRTSPLYESSDYLNSQSFLFLFSNNAQTLIINILLLLISSETGKTYEYNTRTNARRWVTNANGTAVMDSPLQIMLQKSPELIAHKQALTEKAVNVSKCTLILMRRMVIIMSQETCW